MAVPRKTVNLRIRRAIQSGKAWWQRSVFRQPPHRHRDTRLYRHCARLTCRHGEGLPCRHCERLPCRHGERRSRVAIHSNETATTFGLAVTN